MAEKNVIEAIKALRERTGAGMMDCKHALEETDFDMEKAVDWLREKGIAKAAKRANRTAAEGLAAVKTCDKCGRGAIVEVNCETDFVSASDKFHAFADGAVETILEKDPKSFEEAEKDVERLKEDTALATGEKTAFRRYGILTKTPEQGFGSYIHMGGKIGVLLVLAKKDDELASQVAMHIAANAPEFITLADVPAAIREREKGVATAEVAADPKLINKPEAVKAQIIERKVDKVLSQSCLEFQKWLLDESKTVAQVLKEKGNSVVSFIRYQVGEGIAA